MGNGNRYEIIYSAKSILHQRCTDIDQLVFIALIESKHIPEFSKKFKEQHFASLKLSYGQDFEFPLLNSQLSVVYSNEQFWENRVSDLSMY